MTWQLCLVNNNSLYRNNDTTLVVLVTESFIENVNEDQDKRLLRIVFSISMRNVRGNRDLNVDIMINDAGK